MNIKIKVLISSVAALALVLRSIFPLAVPSDVVTLGLLIAVFLPWVGLLFDTAEFPGGWKFKFRELEKHTKNLHEEIERTRSRIDNLTIGAMSPLALKNLQKIASGNFGKYYLGQGLAWQLLYFASLGYISFKCRGIDEVPQNGHQPTELNLSDYVEVTTLGFRVTHEK